MGKHFDRGSLVVMTTTLVLFVMALFTEGLGHDLLLEAGVFLVSAKLVLMACRNSASNATIERRLDEIHRTVRPLRHAQADGRHAMCRRCGSQTVRTTPVPLRKDRIAPARPARKN